MALFPQHGVLIDLVTHDPSTEEYVMYLVEDATWADNGIMERLQGLQQRIYDAIDIAIDGHLAKRFPESKGKGIRIQIDCHGSAPEGVETLSARFNTLLNAGSEYLTAIKAGGFISGLRVVTRSQMGRTA